MSYLPYSPSLEEIGEDERETFQKIADSFMQVGDTVRGQLGKAVRVSHAKATALLTGELVIEDGLPPELAQGLAAAPGRYPAVVRFAQGPGEILDDEISTHRGLAVKLLDVRGEAVPESNEAGTQDFVLEGTSRAFINATAARFLANLKGGVANAPSLPEALKGAVSKISRGTEAALEAVGLESKTLGFFGHPPMHPLAEAYFSQVPMRWGDYVAKVSFAPTQQTIESLAELKLDGPRAHDAFRDAMLAHFAAHGAAFDLRVQLATDPDETPIEDASVEWPADENPYRLVGQLTLPPQTAWTQARDDYFAKLSFSPAHSLASHRPLGQIMRARLFVYGKLAAFRQAANGERAVTPRVEDVPA